MEQLIPQAGTQNISSKMIDYEPRLHDGCLFSATLVAEGDEKPFPQTFKEESFIQYTFLRERLCAIDMRDYSPFFLACCSIVSLTIFTIMSFRKLR